MAEEKSKPPKRYEEVKTRYPDVMLAYENFGNKLSAAGPLTDKEKALVRPGVAMGANLESATKAHVRRGLDAGLVEDELRHAAILSATTIGFPRMMASLAFVEEQLKKA